MLRTVYDENTSRLPHKHINYKEKQKLAYTYPKSTSRDDIISWLMDTCFVENYCIKLCNNDDKDIDDIIQDIYVDILSITQEKWDQLTFQGYGAIRAYISGMIYRQIKSVTSPTYYTYKKYKLKEKTMSLSTWDMYEETNKMPNYGEFDDIQDIE